MRKMQGSRASRIRSRHNQWPFLILYLIYAVRKQPLATSTAMKVLNDGPCFTDFTALEGSTPKKYPPKNQQNPNLGTRNIIFKRCLFGGRYVRSQQGSTLRFSASPCHWKRFSIGRLRLVWPNQPALKHAGDKAGEGFGNQPFWKGLGVAANGPSDFFLG